MSLEGSVGSRRGVATGNDVACPPDERLSAARVMTAAQAERSERTSTPAGRPAGSQARWVRAWMQAKRSVIPLT